MLLLCRATKGQRIQPNELMEHKWPHASMMVM